MEGRQSVALPSVYEDKGSHFFSLYLFLFMWQSLHDISPCVFLHISITTHNTLTHANKNIYTKYQNDYK